MVQGHRFALKCNLYQVCSGLLERKKGFEKLQGNGVFVNFCVLFPPYIFERTLMLPSRIEVYNLVGTRAATRGYTFNYGKSFDKISGELHVR